MIEKTPRLPYGWSNAPVILVAFLFQISCYNKKTRSLIPIFEIAVYVIPFYLANRNNKNESLAKRQFRGQLVRVSNRICS